MCVTCCPVGFELAPTHCIQGTITPRPREGVEEGAVRAVVTCKEVVVLEEMGERDAVGVCGG